MLRPALLLVLALASPAAAEDRWQGRSAAFFGLTFIDTSTEGEIRGPRADEADRLRQVEAQAAEALRAHGLRLADLGPLREKLDRIRNPADCNGCAPRWANEIGADFAVVGEVQKVSNLILAMNLYVFDARTGAQIAGQAVDIRGNTDESWRRGMRYILTRAIFR